MENHHISHGGKSAGNEPAIFKFANCEQLPKGNPIEITSYARIVTPVVEFYGRKSFVGFSALYDLQVDFVGR